MNILSIECSSHQGSIAFTSDGNVVKSWQFQSPRGRGTEMFTHLEPALRETPQIDLVLVGTGPGSYNGLRMAIACAWGIARSKGTRLGGVSSLLGYDSPEYFVAGDARANQWFLAHILDGKFVSPPALLSPQDALTAIQPGISVFATSLLKELPEAVIASPRAEILARREFAEGLPAPVYLKPPHITKPAA